MSVIFRNPREKFPTKLLGGFLGVDWFLPFSLEKVGGENSPQNPQQNSNQNLGVTRQNPHCKDLALSNLSARAGNGLRQHSGRLGFLLFLQDNLHAHKVPRFRWPFGESSRGNTIRGNRTESL